MSVLMVSPCLSAMPSFAATKVDLPFCLIWTLSPVTFSFASDVSPRLAARRGERQGAGCQHADHEQRHRSCTPSRVVAHSPHHSAVPPVRPQPSGTATTLSSVATDSETVADSSGAIRQSRRSRLTPLSSTGPSGSTGSGHVTRLRTASDRTISPRGAAEQRRAPDVDGVADDVVLPAATATEVRGHRFARVEADPERHLGRALLEELDVELGRELLDRDRAVERALRVVRRSGGARPTPRTPRRRRTS